MMKEMTTAGPALAPTATHDGDARPTIPPDAKHRQQEVPEGALQLSWARRRPLADEDDATASAPASSAPAWRAPPQSHLCSPRRDGPLAPGRQLLYVVLVAGEWVSLDQDIPAHAPSPVRHGLPGRPRHSYSGCEHGDNAISIDCNSVFQASIANSASCQRYSI